jgi:hypothetical protein
VGADHHASIEELARRIMAREPHDELRRGVPVRPALDEGNVPGTPSTKGVGIVIAVLLIGAGFIYLGTSFAPSATAPQPPVTTSSPSK